MKKKLTISVILIGIAILLWQFGFFSRYNYLTAQLDIWRDEARIVNFEIPIHACGVPCIGLKEKYGFHELFVGCVVSPWQYRGIESYHRQIEQYLAKRNGENWKAHYQSELDSLFHEDLLE